MKFLDRLLQSWRISKALEHLDGRLRLVDIGAYKGELFERLGGRLTEGYGIEPLIEKPIWGDNYCVIPGSIPEFKPPGNDWDAITMLAVLEHLEPCCRSRIADYCYELLKPGGIVIVTVPSPSSDIVLGLMRKFRLIDGMSLEQHSSFSPKDTLDIFAPPNYVLCSRKAFQLGFNNIFVFKKSIA